MKLTNPRDNVFDMGNFNAIFGEGREVGQFRLEKINDRGERVLQRLWSKNN